MKHLCLVALLALASTTPGYSQKDEDSAKAKRVTIKLIRYTFNYHSGYGSPEIDESEVGFTVTRPSDTEAHFVLEEPLRAGFCYEFEFPSVHHPMVCYTVRQIPGRNAQK